MYAIKWTAKPTQYQGQSDFIFTTENEAQYICDEKNSESEYIFYEVIEEETPLGVNWNV